MAPIDVRGGLTQLRILRALGRPAEERLPSETLAKEVQRLALFSLTASFAAAEAGSTAEWLETHQPWPARHFDWPARHNETLNIGIGLDAGRHADSFRELGDSLVAVALALGSEVDRPAILAKAEKMARDGPPERPPGF